MHRTACSIHHLPCLGATGTDDTPACIGPHAAFITCPELHQCDYFSIIPHPLSVPAAGGAFRDHIRYLPTACLALMDLLHTTRPHHTLIAADFNTLPDVVIPGTCAPLVSSLVRTPPGPQMPRGMLDVCSCASTCM